LASVIISGLVTTIVLTIVVLSLRRHRRAAVAVGPSTGER
jgi:hypothetical protein